VKNNKAMEIQRNPLWWMGGASDMMAACITHPLDMLKVQLQTQQTTCLTGRQLAVNVVKLNGIKGFYNGISAAWLRLGTYSTTRWFVYNNLKITFTNKENPHLTFFQKIFCAAASGVCGGVVGVPADKVNVRMQNDVKLQPNLRKNYKNVFHGLFVIIKTEGIMNLFSGFTMFCGRAVVLTIGQFVTYDQFKQSLLSQQFNFLGFKDNFLTHLICSFGAGTIASLIAQPFDTMKTRMQIAKPGEFRNYLELFHHTKQTGLLAFYKGLFPAWIRLNTHTVLIFLIFEQLRINFGSQRF